MAPGELLAPATSADSSDQAAAAPSGLAGSAGQVDVDPAEKPGAPPGGPAGSVGQTELEALSGSLAHTDGGPCAGSGALATDTGLVAELAGLSGQIDPELVSGSSGHTDPDALPAAVAVPGDLFGNELAGLGGSAGQAEPEALLGS